VRIVSDESHTTIAPPRPLRRDAERNRQRILASAKVLFAEYGVDVGLDDIARHAGVGVGTAYRRFPDRETLIDELLEDKISEIEAIVEAALGLDDPWEGLVWFLEQSQQKHAGDRGLKQALLVPTRGAERLAAARGRIEPKIRSLIERARESGDLRPDFEPEDFPLLVEMITAVGDATRDLAPEIWRRYLRILIDGLATRRDRPSDLGPEALSRAQLEDVLCGRAAGPRESGK
jgi:AcrR family transcriptional regulator